MNIVAGMTIGALREHGVPELPTYDRALAAACTAYPPPFGAKEYGDLYRSSAIDPDWVALSLLMAAQSEGEGARHLWDMAACTPDAEIARQMQQHAIDEARHSRVYVTLLGLIFPEALVDETRHIAYTARLIERAAHASDSEQVTDLMRERVKDFNELTEQEIAQETLAAA
jgi:hypothetical protein